MRWRRHWAPPHPFHAGLPPLDRGVGRTKAKASLSPAVWGLDRAGNRAVGAAEAIEGKLIALTASMGQNQDPRSLWSGAGGGTADGFWCGVCHPGAGASALDHPKLRVEMFSARRAKSTKSLRSGWKWWLGMTRAPARQAQAVFLTNYFLRLPGRISKREVYASD
jgi:hypothetical protein